MNKAKVHLLSREVFSKLIDHIGEVIFEDTVYYFRSFMNEIEHENNLKEKEELQARTLNYFRDRFTRFFYDSAIFPYAEIDYLNQRVKISATDVNEYFSTINLFNSDADDLIITDVEDDVFAGEKRKIVPVNDWKSLMKLLKKKWDENEYHCKYNHIQEVFSDVAVYSELRKLSQHFKMESGLKNPIKFFTKEIALAYIFDLYAKGEQIPINRVDGSVDAKKLKEIGVNVYNIIGDTFYRAVKEVAKYDLNKQSDLENISKGWLGAVKALSKDWVSVSEYLRKKQLLKD